MTDSLSGGLSRVHPCLLSFVMCHGVLHIICEVSEAPGHMPGWHKGSALSVLAAHLCIPPWQQQIHCCQPQPATGRSCWCKMGLVFLRDGVSSATSRVYMLKDESYKGLWLA